jgi:hypothetical protein
MHVVWENASIHINTLSINFNEAYMIWNLIGSIGGKVLDPNVITETGSISCIAEPQEAGEFLIYK